MDKATDEIKNKINSLINDKNPDKFIYCIWYCVKTNNRLPDEEFDNICNCYEIYRTQKLPIILIFTIAADLDDSKKLMIQAQENLNHLDNSYRNYFKITRVLAKDKEHNKTVVDKAYGIYNLMEQTCQSAKKGIESSLYESLSEKVKNYLKEKFENIVTNIFPDSIENNSVNYDEAPLTIKSNNNDLEYLPSGQYKVDYNNYVNYDAENDCFFYKGKPMNYLTEKEKQNLKKQIIQVRTYNYMNQNNKNTYAFPSNIILKKNKYLEKKGLKFIILTIMIVIIIINIIIVIFVTFIIIVINIIIIVIFTIIIIVINIIV